MPGSGGNRINFYFRGPKWMAWAGWGLLSLLAIWWVANFVSTRPPKLVAHSPYTFTMLRYEFLGIDFIHNYAAVRTWQKTGDPYRHLEGDPKNLNYLPAPPTLLFFGWTLALSPDYQVKMRDPASTIPTVAYPFRAIVVWFIVSVAMFGFFAMETVHAREALSLTPMPVPWLLALILASYPVMFELERGNFNVLVLFFVVLGACRWRRLPAVGREVVTGICAAFAGALKIFPLIFLPGLLVVRRYIAALAMLATLLALALSMATLFSSWGHIVPHLAALQVPSIPFAEHSLSNTWQHLWRGTPLGNFPPTAGALLMIAVPAGIVSGFVFFSAQRVRLLLPYLLWLAALGTCAMMISVDYNLLFLVLATLMLWDRRDPWWLQVALLPWLLVWQPFLLVPARVSDAQWVAGVFFVMKLWSVLAVGGLLIWRINALNRSTGGMPDSPARASFS